jgi:hypothetical protein
VSATSTSVATGTSLTGTAFAQAVTPGNLLVSIIAIDQDSGAISCNTANWNVIEKFEGTGASSITYAMARKLAQAGDNGAVA